MRIKLETRIIPQNTVCQDLSILQWNVWYKNKNPEQLLVYLEQTKYPDIILLQEVTEDIVEKLKPLHDQYPFYFSDPSGAYGMSIYSKIPFTRIIRRQFQVSDNHYTEIHLDMRLPIVLIELHASSPGSDKNGTRKIELQEIATVIKHLAIDHKILIGDLNTTPYSPYFYALTKNTKLQNGMNGHRVQGTWPSNLPFFMRIPIDHLLHSNTIDVVNQKLLPSLGSDHFPVYSELKLFSL